MRAQNRQSGLTFTEMAVVIFVISLLAALVLPAARALFKSLESDTGGKSMISAALSCARAIAAKEQRYTGVRFQQDAGGKQYMIVIIHDFESTGLSAGFRAFEGLKPTRLPEGVGVMDLKVRTRHGTSWSDAENIGSQNLGQNFLDDTNPQNLGPDGKNKYITDTTTFSIIFSPAGRLIIHDVRVRNKNAVYQPDNNVTGKVSIDDVFNSPINIKNHNVGMFIQDDYAERGLGAESSRNWFVIYDKTQFDKLDDAQRLEYINSLERNYLNPYTGTIISSD